MSAPVRVGSLCTGYGGIEMGLRLAGVDVDTQPTHVAIENVRNLISIHGGRLWAGILADLASLGYGVRWLTLGACHVGAAHHRHRVFAVTNAEGQAS